MTYYIYKTITDNPRVLEFKYNENVLRGSGLSFVSEQENNPKLHGDEKLVEGVWVPPVQVYSVERLESYPPIGDQFDALWHAMDRGDLPKIPEFYDPIKQVKDKHPKTMPEL